MKHIILIGLVLVVLLGAFSMVSAQDSDNACAGGLLDGRCNSDWAWICGYYLEHWQAAGGWNSSYAFPDWCDPASLLPPKPQVTPTSVCYFSASDDFSFYYSGINQTLVTWYDEGVLDCSGAPHDYGPYYAIEASDEITAQAICDTLLSFGYIWNPNQESGYNSPANLWLCYDSR